MKRLILLAAGLALVAAACNNDQSSTDMDPTMSESQGSDAGNPFFTESDLPLHYPPFDKVDIDHYLPAFERGMEEHSEEIQAIADNPDAPTVENTLVAMQLSGPVLDRVSTMFFSLTSAHTNDDMESIQSKVAPMLAAHSDKIRLNPKLFARVETLYENRNSMDADAETKRLIEETYKDFVRAGAQLSEEDKEKMRGYNAELAKLQTSFSQNVLKEVNRLAVVVDTREELTGLTDAQIDGAAAEATDRGMEGKFVLALRNTSGQPPLAVLENRALREKMHKASLSRGSSGGEFDNRDILTKVARIRAEKAELLGFDNHAAYSLQNQTAKTTAAVNERLATLAPPAVANARREAQELQKMIDSKGGDFQLAPWDWAYYTEKVRADKYNFDASQLKPYLELNNVLEKGVFFAANKLFGLTFKERTDLPTYQEDVRVWDVFDKDGSQLSIFLGDFYQRPSKRGGAWMNAYVPQSGLKGTLPVVANHMNIPKPPAGEPTLMTFDEVTTMFHEFGHALHGMFSDVHYPEFAGTSVPRDFVEYPSQVNEMWVTWPEVLKNYAKHHETGEDMPQELLDKVLAASKFNQGFATTEYLAASLLDQAWHQLKPNEVPDADALLAFEANALEAAGVALEAVPPRYRSTYFSHIIGGYSAGYYSYIWSEVLDADSVEWFKENGGLTRENGEHFRETLLSRGGSEDAMTLFRNFRGADPDIGSLLERRGLTGS